MTITEGAGIPMKGGSPSGGGAVLSQGSANLTLSDDAITNSFVMSGLIGGGVLGVGHQLTLQRDLVTGNDQEARERGSIASDNANALAVLDTTVAGNTTSSNVGSGGGIFTNDSGNDLLENDTITGNDAGDRNQGGGGGGLDIEQPGVKALNVIVAHNTSLNNNGEANCRSIPTRGFSLGHNIEDTNECGFTAAGDKAGTDPRLGPLGANGGPTQSEVPLAGSPAIDKGDNSSYPALDQRGIPRPQGAGCDIGAVELTTPTAATGQPTESPSVARRSMAAPTLLVSPAARSTSTARARASGRFRPRPHSRQAPLRNPQRRHLRV